MYLNTVGIVPLTGNGSTTMRFKNAAAFENAQGEPQVRYFFENAEHRIAAMPYAEITQLILGTQEKLAKVAKFNGKTDLASFSAFAVVVNKLASKAKLTIHYATKGKYTNVVKITR